MIKVYCAQVACLEDEVLFNEAYKGLNMSRRAKIDKIKNEDSKRASCGAGLLLKKALLMNGYDYDALLFDTDINGKPFIKNVEENKVYFNLSHSKGYVMCILSTVKSGCDVQFEKRYVEGVAKKFSKMEYEIISKAGDDLKKEYFFRYWTIKESFIKAKGLGLGMDLSSFGIDINDEKLFIDDEDGRYFLKEYFHENAVGYRFSACALSEEILSSSMQELYLCDN